MATVTTTDKGLGANCYLSTWSLTTADATGDAVELPMASDRSVQAKGTWGGATMDIEGSLDGTNWEILNDPGSSALTKTDDFLEAILENVRYIRPILSTAGTDAAITVTILHRNQR